MDTGQSSPDNLTDELANQLEAKGILSNGLLSAFAQEFVCTDNNTKYKVNSAEDKQEESNRV